MERATGLEALAEEDDEEYGISDDSISDEDEHGDGGVKKGEPNKFDGLCDGVLNASALVHATLNELLELKDDLLKHALPPNVLMKIALVITKVFRSQSDMQSPLNELLRMVRLYSTPWEEKSAALKKLHEDYNTKKDQLNVAVKRLQLIDAHSRSIAKERRIMNWEKLFSKLTSTRGHGRRWKFLIEPFRRKYHESPEALHAYVEEMENDSDQSDTDEDGAVDTQMQHMTSYQASVEPNADQTDEESDDETEIKDSELESVDSGQKASTMITPYIRPPTRDQETWTHEPSYERYLHMRIFKPEGLDFRELRCYVSYGNERHKTNILDPLPKDEEAVEEAPAVNSRGRPIRGRGGRGSGRGRQRPGGAIGKPAPQPQEQNRPNEPDAPYFEEIRFSMPENLDKFISLSKYRKTESLAHEPQHLQIAVHYGPREEMIAMATIEEDDLNTLELPVLNMIPPIGDELPSEDNFEKLNINTLNYEEDPEKVLKDVSPTNFPLYSVHTGKSDSVHLSNGHIPVVCFWVKQLQPRKFNRATESETVRDIVYEATGYDITVVTKEDLHKETREQCLSALSFASNKSKDTSISEEEEKAEQQTEEQIISKEQYDQLILMHEQEMQNMQHEYEQKLQDLVLQFQQIQEAMLEAQSASNSPHRVVTPKAEQTGTKTRQKSSPEITIPVENIQTRSKTQGEIPRRKIFYAEKELPVWGENLPKNFLDRLKMFEHESKVHHEDNVTKTNKEIQSMLEKKYAAEYKLSKGDINDAGDNPMEDICLPAVFMPTVYGNKAAVYNPRAAKYFHPSGAGGVRLTQPPSMVHLPPIPKNKLSVINLFDVSHNFQKSGGNQWLVDRYLKANQPEAPSSQPYTPMATMISTNNVNEMMKHSSVKESTTLTLGSSPIKEAMLE